MASCSFDLFRARPGADLRPRIPAEQHHRQTHQKRKEADLVDAVHHAQIDPRILVFLEQIDRIDVIQELLEKHVLGVFRLNLLCNHRNFHSGPFGKGFHRHSFACGEWLGHGLAVGRIHGRVVVHRRQENRCLDHVVQVESCGLEDGFRISDALRSCHFHWLDNQDTCGRVERDLAADEYEPARFQGLAVSCHRLRGLVGVDA